MELGEELLLTFPPQDSHTKVGPATGCCGSLEAGWLRVLPSQFLAVMSVLRDAVRASEMSGIVTPPR